MLRNINRNLRYAFLVIGAILVVLNLTEKKKDEAKDNNGYQSEIFDDIW